MALPIKQRPLRYSIILLCASTAYGYIISIIISPDNPLYIGKFGIIGILLLFVIGIAVTLVKSLRPKTVLAPAEDLFTGLTIGSAIFSVFYLIRLLSS